MIKLKKILGAFGLSVLFFLTGCADKGTLGQSTAEENNSDIGTLASTVSEADTEIELLPITEVMETFDVETEKIKSGIFDNINFEGTYFFFTEANEVYTLEYEKTKFKCSPDEAYDYFCKMTDQLLPGMYSDEEKAQEIRFVDCDTINDEKFPYGYPTFEQYKQMGLATDQPYPIIVNQNCFIEMSNEILRGYDRGDLKRRGGYNLDALTDPATSYGYKDDGRIDMFEVLIAYPIVYRTANLESEKTFHLVTGDISIAEAVKSANKYFSELELSPREVCKTVVQSVNVIDIGNGCYAFCFAVVPEYKQVKFARPEMDKNTNGITSISDTTNETQLVGSAVMYKKDDICRCRLGNLLFYYDIMETDSQSSVIPLGKAAECVSNYMTAGIKFNVKSVTATYKEISAKDHSQYPDYESFDNRKITIKPCWRFVLKPTTGDTSKLYYAYVDMISGKIYTLVQLMESEVEYD